MMKVFILNFLLICCVVKSTNAQVAKVPQTNILKKGKYTLTFINQDASLDNIVQFRMISTFFKVYPELAKTFNKNTVKEVTIVVDTAYQGVAETNNGKVTISSRWMHLHPEDIDVVTYEVMHIVQDYGETTWPGWLTEGIADYARYKFGVNNAADEWTLPNYKPTQKYTDANRVAARFLLWMEEKVNPNIVEEVDDQLRKHTYNDNTWKQLSGKTLDELWKSYTTNPDI